MRGIAAVPAAVLAFTIWALPAADGFGQSRFDRASCTIDGVRLAGRVQVVDHFADFRVRVVRHFEDLRVRVQDHFAGSCGEWTMVEHFPDFTVTFVDAFPDFTIRYVTSFPGAE